MAPDGSLLCLGSATAFGAMAIFGKLVFAEGASAGTLLAGRFVLAAAVLWCVLLVRGALPTLGALRRRDIALALGLGACGYALQAGCYFLALERIDASLLSLLLYTFPAIVTVAAVALGRERIERRRVVALGLVSAGLTLVLAGAGAGALEGIGVALALGAAFVYSTYILASDGVARRLPALTLATLVCTGAAISLTVGSTAAGQFHPGAITAAGWGWLGCLAVVSTVAAIAMFFAGLGRVGPTTASILSTVEPVVTVALASVVFAERLSGLQLAGGVLVLTAVIVLRTGRAAPEVRTPVAVARGLRSTGAAGAARPARASTSSLGRRGA
jgi:drug/metabolite transporter (DMT)-like permease